MSCLSPLHYAVDQTSQITLGLTNLEKIISANVPLSSLPPFLAEMPYSNPGLSGASHNRATRPFPYEVVLKGDGLRAVSLKLQSNGQPTAHRKDRKGRRRLVEIPPAMFWRLYELKGGKSSGYAIGYEGSWLVDDEHEQRQRGLDVLG